MISEEGTLVAAGILLTDELPVKPENVANGDDAKLKRRRDVDVNPDTNIAGDSHNAADRFSCVLAAPRVFHLFCQDEDDDWAPTLEEVNASTYDPLKLKRVSFFLDVGLPHGNPMGFGFDGSMIIPRNPHLRSADDAVDEFNRVVAAFVLGGLQFSQVSASDLAFGSLYTTGYYRYEDPHGVLPRLHQAWGEASAGGYLSIELLDPPRLTRAEVVAALDIGKPVVEAAHRMDPASLVVAFGHHINTEYRNSLVYSWLIIEQLIGQMWDEAFIPHRAIAFKERIGQLQASARTAAIRIEFLTEAGLIGRKLYRYLQRARTARNELIHKAVRPSQGDSYFSLVALAQLLELISQRSGVTFDTNNLLRGAGRGNRQRSDDGVTRAADADWANVTHWCELRPIPGEPNWSGEFERRPGIQLTRTKR